MSITLADDNHKFALITNKFYLKMTALITILISLLGYGTPSDYEGYTESQLQHEITLAEQTTTNVDGGAGQFDDAN